MSRCLAGAFITPDQLKRCVREEHDKLLGPAQPDHLWVEATNADGTAMVVRWRGNSKQPYEILIARKEE